MSYSFREMEQDIREMNKRIDAEVLLSLAAQAELINPEEWVNRSYSGHIDVDEVIFQMAKAIIKHRFDHLEGSVIRIHRNQTGFSVSVKTDAILQILEFVNGYYSIDPRDNEFDYIAFNTFLSRLKRPTFHLFSQGSTFQMKNNRLVFYFKHNEGYRYDNPDFLVFYAIFEMVHLVEEWEVAAREQLQHFLNEYNEHLARKERIEREERERIERELRERQEREQRERERREAEERARREEYERRQRLLQAGATEEGINIANRLLELLGRGNL